MTPTASERVAFAFRRLVEKGRDLMAKVRIFKRDGTGTRYFWSSKDTADPTSVKVYRRTAKGVKRVRNVRFNTLTNRMRRPKAP